MIDFLDIIQERDEIYAAATQYAFDNVPHVTAGISQYIDAQFGVDLNRALTWEGIHKVDDTLVVIGVLGYPIGSTIIHPQSGELVEVSEKNVHYFRQIVKFNIPLSVVYKNSIELINSNLQETLDASKSKMETEYQNILQQDQLNGFNITELTNDQLLLLQNGNNYTRSLH